MIIITHSNHLILQDVKVSIQVQQTTNSITHLAVKVKQKV